MNKLNKKIDIVRNKFKQAVEIFDNATSTDEVNYNNFSEIEQLYIDILIKEKSTNQTHLFSSVFLTKEEQKQLTNDSQANNAVKELTLDLIKESAIKRMKERDEEVLKKQIRNISAADENLDAKFKAQEYLQFLMIVR